MQPATRLHGYDAIGFAEAFNLRLSCYASAHGPARHHLTTEQAREIAQQDPSLIYIGDWPDETARDKPTRFLP